MSKTRVLFIINSYSAGGGAESLLTQIVNNLDRDRYEIGIFEIIHFEGIKKEPTRKDVKIYPYFTLADAPDRKQRMYYVYHEWNKVINEYIPQDYDLYVSFNYLKPTFLLPEHKKCIAWIHGDIYNLLNNDKQEERELQRLSFGKADKIVAISNHTYQSIIDLYPEYKGKTTIIYNGINIRNIREKARQHTDIHLISPSIISVGRLDANKDPIRLLKIFNEVLKKNPLVHLYYMGYGSLKDDIVKMAKNLGISEHVDLLGYIDNPFPILKQADVMAMFSKSEGFPMALLESVSLGVPFVASDIGGAWELSDNGKAGRVVNDNAGAVIEILSYLKKSKEISSNGCVQTINKFDFGHYIKQIEELFKKVLDK